MRILVLGDGLLDLTRYSTRVRTSPEAKHCWIIRESHREWTLGGAANVARWLAADARLQVTLMTPYGDDWASGILKDLCLQGSIQLSRRFWDTNLSVTIKERFIVEDAEKGRCHQLLRVDKDEIGSLLTSELPAIEHDLCTKSRYDAIVAVDYDKFVFRGETGQHLIELLGGIVPLPGGKCLGLPVFVNSKRPARWKDARCTFLICNHEEMATSLGVHDVRTAGVHVKADHFVVTQGAGGVTVTPSGGDPIHRLTQSGEVLDVTGAGDAFTAGLIHAALCRRAHSLRNLRPVDLVDLVDSGQRFAAWCCAQVGCGNPPAGEAGV